MKRLLLALIILALAGCAAGSGQPRLPYDYWYVGLAAPRFMEVWVESVDVIDRRGLAYFHIHGGVVSYTGNPVGWHNGGGAMKQASNVDLPETLFVRWQSLVEPQTYKLRIDIPQWVRDEMLQPQRTYCQGSKSWETDYRKIVSIGMAPVASPRPGWVGHACRISRSGATRPRSIRGAPTRATPMGATTALLLGPRRPISSSTASLMNPGNRHAWAGGGLADRLPDARFILDNKPQAGYPQ
ncbi:hypothetical protein PHLH8_26850 [Pseudomonas sp. Pc102]|nr:hypothetical protein PHLH8_26850 [Pseudomonas sp. Pc102]